MVTVVVDSVTCYGEQQSLLHARYKQDKHVDGLQSDSWILLKCFVLELWLASSP